MITVIIDFSPFEETKTKGAPGYPLRTKMLSVNIWRLVVLLFTALNVLAVNQTETTKKPVERTKAAAKLTHDRRHRRRHCSSSSSSSSCESSSSSSFCPPRCCEEKAVETVRRMVKQWPDYVNTGNIGFLIENWVMPDATITVTGDPFTDRCDTHVDSFMDYLFYRDNARILYDLINIKTIKYRRDGSVLAIFVIAAGVKGHNLALYNESWLFYPRKGCNYALSEAAEVKVGCLEQDPAYNFNNMKKQF
jgi:hypothetical protein